MLEGILGLELHESGQKATKPIPGFGVFIFQRSAEMNLTIENRHMTAMVELSVEDKRKRCNEAMPVALLLVSSQRISSA